MKLTNYKILVTENILMFTSDHILLKIVY